MVWRGGGQSLDEGSESRDEAERVHRERHFVLNEWNMRGKRRYQLSG
jgi:hypothetical protein